MIRAGQWTRPTVEVNWQETERTPARKFLTTNAARHRRKSLTCEQIARLMRQWSRA